MTVTIWSSRSVRPAATFAAMSGSLGSSRARASSSTNSSALADARDVAASIRLPARVTIAGLVALTLLEILWEAVLAPIPGARWLALKALPLALLVPGVARGERRPRQWLSLLVPFYFAEALVRALTETGRHSAVAAMAALLAAITFLALLAWFRAEKRR